MRNPRSLKERMCAASMIGLNNSLAVFPGAKSSETFCETELNENLLNSMSKIWISQAYVQRFYCEYIVLKHL